ncbi:DNA-3-methyladenine glycosylase [Rathayibacter tritici]|uniref:Putative 3-methyladenine DNA glycosylase n=1 Tax=Rathayibacter tritici TaxID=33888 RepID=A0A169BWV8_9MICO|nr:DNA-3-methyladenine glycosylase [Rathayibacter tritici]AND16181.1 DNA-3-methyladenine glycosidase [Rathayibacter tritici]PPF24095.1 DNA-3-methyladenine glycosylase [Rathayibacter tritici]PPI12437.1 DNA-3-methyladenine glycosylase [Rathayibacter tritici]PPI42519.1 DNA-3-methyladenine glycosylase [Rathayibacter tritici]
MSLPNLSRSALEVAPELLGRVLLHRTREGVVGVRLTEVEAYLGTGEDPGSHAHRGPTPRTAPMFGAPGSVYASFTYGMHTCVNIVCSPTGVASAVLLRAGEVVLGEELALLRRGPVRHGDIARGPARLAKALGVQLSESGDPLETAFELLPGEPPTAVITGPRTGVSGSGGGEEFPWRFSIPGDPTVSPYRPAVPRRRPAG